jgi:hypothetical protein
MSQMPPNAGGPPTPRRPRKTTRYLVITALAATGAFFGAGAVGTNLDDEPDTSACEAALQRNYEDASAEVKAGRAPETKPLPAQCFGVDDATLERFASEIAVQDLSENLDDALNSATAQP